MAIQNDNTILCKGDLKAYHEKILPYLGGNFALKTRVSDYYVQDEEILIGVWGDGRPLYRKSIVVSNALDNASTFTTVAIPHGITNIKINGGVTVYGCWVVGDNSSGSLPTHAYNNGGTSEYLCDIFNIDSTNITLSYKGDWRNAILIIHIEYTKTTDAANSAVATAGAYDINFPNTWPEKKEIFFGNGLYGWKGSLDNVTLANNAEWISTTDFSSGVKRICNEGGTFINNTDNYSIHTGLHSQSAGKFIDSGFFIDTNSKLKAYVANTCGKSIVWSLKNAWVTYTK